MKKSTKVKKLQPKKELNFMKITIFIDEIPKNIEDLVRNPIQT